MKATPAVPAHRRRQRGQALAYVGIAMVAITGFAVVGVDVGRLAFTAAEVQSIADAAATAAVGALGAHRPDPLADATSVVQQNYVDGRYGTVGAAATDVIKSITPGHWDFAAATFTANGSWTDPNTNAARARAVARVDNLVAAALGMLQSDVERQSTAAIGGACTETTSLPIAIELDAIQNIMDSPDCRNMQTAFFQVPTDNSCFTSLSTDAAGADEQRSHIPTQCDGQGGNDGGGVDVSLSIGDPIRLNNGAQSSVLKTIQGCLDASPALREFVVPVIASNGCAPSNDGTTQPVVAFARIWIDSVQDTTSDKYVRVMGVCREDVTGSNPGCNTGGENAVAIVK